MRDYPARNCSTKRTINLSFIETENRIYARYYKHVTQTQFSRTAKRFVIAAIMRLLIFVTLDGKTYSNDFYKRFTSRSCQPFEWLGHPFARNSPFEWLPSSIQTSICSNNLVTHLLATLNCSNNLVTHFVQNIRPFERLDHLYYGIPLNLLSNDMHGRRVTVFVQKIHLFQRSLNSMCSRFAWLHLTSLLALNSYFALFKTTLVHKHWSWSGFFFRCSRLWAFQRPLSLVRRNI